MEPLVQGLENIQVEFSRHALGVVVGCFQDMHVLYQVKAQQEPAIITHYIAYVGKKIYTFIMVHVAYGAA